MMWSINMVPFLIKDSKLLMEMLVMDIFLDSCYHHCAEWNSIRINGQLSGTAVQAWYNGAADSKFFQQQTYPCTSCCTPVVV